MLDDYLEARVNAQDLTLLCALGAARTVTPAFNTPDHGAVVPQEGLPDKYFWQHNGSYRLNVSRRHPPSVIAQPQGDDFVPPTVAENYIQALRAANISGNR